MDYLYAVVLFAISASVTPGPNNIMVMSAGANFGIRKSLPLLMGICVGFTLMLLLVGLGFGQLFTLFPNLAEMRRRPAARKSGGEQRFQSSKREADHEASGPVPN